MRNPDFILVEGRPMSLLIHPRARARAPEVEAEDEYSYPPEVRLRIVRLPGMPANDNEVTS